MKTRQGFVSNSSSSSFIIGVGIATAPANIKKLQEVDNYEVTVKPLSEVVEQGYNSWSGDGYHAEQDMYKVNSFQDTDERVEGVMETYTENPNAVLVQVDITSEDDCGFWKEEYGEYYYDIDFDFFSEGDREVVTKCDSLCDTFNWHYGAGRDG